MRLASEIRERWISMRSSLGSKTGKDTQLALSSQVLAALFGFVGNIILIRAMPVAAYGLYSLFISAFMLCAGFFHLGWIETFTRFGAKFRSDPLYSAIRNSLLARTLISAGVLASLAVAGSGWVSRVIYRREDFTPFLLVAAVGAVGLCGFSFTQCELRVRGRFRAYFVSQAGAALVRMMLIAGLAGVGWLALGPVVGVQVIVPIFFGLAAVFMRGPIPSAAAPGSLAASPVREEIFHYNRWLLVSMFSTNLIGNIDTHFLAHYHTNETISAFGVASRLTLPIFFVVSALTSAVLPRLSAAKDLSEIRLYVDRISSFLALAAAGILILVWVAPPALVWLAGEKYAGIDSLLRLQILTALVMLLAGPFGIILSALGQVRYLAAMNVLQLVVDLGLNFLWIPSMGARGAVLATLVINLIGLVAIGARVWRTLSVARSTG